MKTRKINRKLKYSRNKMLNGGTANKIGERTLLTTALGSPVITNGSSGNEVEPNGQSNAEDILTIIRNDVIETFTKMSKEEQDNIRNRIRTAIENTRKNKSSLRRTVNGTSGQPGQSQSDQSSESPTSSKYNFKTAKDKFIMSLNTKIINRTQSNFINNVLKYYSSYTSSLLQRPTLDDPYTFAESQYDELYKKAYESSDPIIENIEFRKILDKTFAYIETNQYVKSIKVVKKNNMFWRKTSISRELNRTESNISKKLENQNKLLSQINSGIEILRSLDNLKKILIQKSSKVNKPIQYYDANNQADAITELQRLKREGESKEETKEENQSLKSNIENYQELVNAYSDYSHKNEEVTNFKNELVMNTKPPRCKDYYNSALELQPELTAHSTDNAERIKTLSNSSDTTNKTLFEKYANTYRPFVQYLIPANSTSFVPVAIVESNITLETLDVFKEIIEDTIKNTKITLEDKRGYINQQKSSE